MLKKSILLFDGVCNLCNSSVQWVIDRDHEEKFQFASLQSDFSKQKLKQLNVQNEGLNTVILIDDEKIFKRSSAALEVLRRLGGVWQLFYVFKIIPAPIRDVIYNFIAKNRYRWFGKEESCRIPTPELKHRFLD